MSEKIRTIRVRLNHGEWEKFRKIQGHFTATDLDFKSTDQGTIIRLINDFHVIMEDLPDVLEKIEALKAKLNN